METAEMIEKLEGIDLNPVIDRWMEENYGPRCEEYEPLCACCVGWKIRDTTGLRAKFEQVMEEIDKLQPKGVTP